MFTMVKGPGGISAKIENLQHSVIITGKFLRIFTIFSRHSIILLGIARKSANLSSKVIFSFTVLGKM